MTHCRSREKAAVESAKAELSSSNYDLSDEDGLKKQFDDEKIRIESALKRKVVKTQKPKSAKSLEENEEVVKTNSTLKTISVVLIIFSIISITQFTGIIFELFSTVIPFFNDSLFFELALLLGTILFILRKRTGWYIITIYYSRLFVKGLLAMILASNAIKFTAFSDILLGQLKSISAVIVLISALQVIMLIQKKILKIYGISRNQMMGAVFISAGIYAIWQLLG